MRWRRSSISSSATACPATRDTPRRGSPRATGAESKLAHVLVGEPVPTSPEHALNGREEGMSESATQPTGGAARPSTVPRMQTTTSDVAIEISGMHKWYGEFHVLRDINLTVK